MATLNKKTFLGFGLGAVQSGLMLYEAFKSNNFQRYVILEVNKNIVDAVRKWGNKIVVNTATKHNIIKTTISGFEIYNPDDTVDHDAIKAAIKESDEMATAVPSIDVYDLGKYSIAKLLAENINPAKSQILYAAENNNYAAEILVEKMKLYTDEKRMKQFQAINTVIGKMGGVIFDKDTIAELNLNLMTPYSQAAILVEEFNNIIVSKVTLPDFQRGITVFREKDDLLPFEEAKLYGHNAVHSMLGFFASLRGFTYMSEIRNDPHLYKYGMDTFTNESGSFLLRKYREINDPLFTKEGFDFYGEDLLERMTNPYLRDEVKRICRDPIRKLEYDDRLFGTIREALKHKIYPKILTKAVLGGICYIINNQIDTGFLYPSDVDDLNELDIKDILVHIWKETSLKREQEEILNLVCSEYHEFSQEFINIKKY